MRPWGQPVARSRKQRCRPASTPDAWRAAACAAGGGRNGRFCLQSGRKYDMVYNKEVTKIEKGGQKATDTAKMDTDDEPQRDDLGQGARLAGRQVERVCGGQRNDHDGRHYRRIRRLFTGKKDGVGIQKGPAASTTRNGARRGIGRGRRTRTLNKGFGDPRVTITPCPYILCRSCSPAQDMAESQGFEPWVRYQRTHDFQSCAISRIAFSGRKAPPDIAQNRHGFAPFRCGYTDRTSGATRHAPA